MHYQTFIDAILDDKYLIERELGRGGMGTVYLATHVGTERPVAVKIIAPQFMERAEFVERFRREARAAGRLRHPNVVDVTDFGLADTRGGKVAYLVMEYLDGCTLGEILDEEKNLPVSWTIDILEQVCSAVHEAHNQGIIHRDLKPDNIWLEPNPSGGYTVKVLDFGIAKLEENITKASADLPADYQPILPPVSDSFSPPPISARETLVETPRTATGVSEAATIAPNFDNGNTLLSEAGTMIQNGAPENSSLENSPLSEDKTALFQAQTDSGDTSQEDVGTRLLTGNAADENSVENGFANDSVRPVRNTSELTRVGAVLGTPLFMSPEQVRGEKLTPRSDIYSLGVIAYRMLGGTTPFDGDYKSVMNAHRELAPPPLAARKVPRRIKKVIYSALAKNTDERPQTAEAFASKLRSQSEGIFALLRRSLVIYSEHLPKFLALTTFLSLPMVLLTVLLIAAGFLRVSGAISDQLGQNLIYIFGALFGIFSAFCTYLILGTTTWIVSQYLAVPLRPIRLRPALKESAKKWKAFAGTGLLSTFLSFVFGGLTCGIGFLVASAAWSLAAPVVMMENLRGWKALKRSARLVKRSILTTVSAMIIMFLLPATFSGAISFFVNVTARAFMNPAKNNVTITETTKTNETDPAAPPPVPNAGKDERGVGISFGSGQKIRFNNDAGKDMQTRIVNTFLETLIQIFWLPAHIFVTSFSSIVIALLYLKTRQAGGESMKELLAKFEETDEPRKKWQERVRNRLIQSGRLTSNISKS